MKISYISGSILPSEKANAVHVMKMCQAFSRHKKASVRLYGKRGALLKNPYQYYDVKNNFKLTRSWFGKTFILSGILRLISIIVHAGMYSESDIYYGRDILGLYLLSLLSKQPIFFESHQIPSRTTERKTLIKLMQSPNLKGIVVISKGLENDLKKEFPFYKGPILVAHDGADIPASYPKKIAQKDWRGRRNILQVGYTGSLHKGKGMELLYDVAKLVPEMDFHVIGGPQELVEKWKEKDLPTNLFMHGLKPHAEIPSYLATFDIVLAPYQAKIHIKSGADIARWISPLKLFEYMAARKAILCSDLPVLREVITHGKNGVLASPTDPTTWADSLCNLAKSAALREALGQEAFKDLQDHYSWNKRADNILSFIEKNTKR